MIQIPLQPVAAGLLGVILTIASGPAPAQDEESDFDGEWQYNEYCAACHGFNGEGFYPFGVALRGNPFVQNAPIPALVEVIQEGRYDNVAFPAYSAMPAFNFIRGAQARAIAAYMRGGLQQAGGGSSPAGE